MNTKKAKGDMPPKRSLKSRKIMKNINTLRIDIDIDDNNFLTNSYLRANIDLPKEFNDKVLSLLLLPIDEAVKEIKAVYGDKATIAMGLVEVALYNSRMVNGNEIINKQFLKARKMEYVRNEK